MEPDITELERFPTYSQTRVRGEAKGITNLVNGVLELENKLVSKLERGFQDVYQPDIRKLDTTQA